MTTVRRDLPSGTVTFLFTDVEGSTKPLRELGAEAYGEALLEHRRVLREAFDAGGASRSIRKATPCSSPSRPRRARSRSEVLVAR
jgi:class 3 adenylate cyclase